MTEQPSAQSESNDVEAAEEQRFVEPDDDVKRRNFITGLLIGAIILTIMTISVITRLTAS